ncbi:MAG: ribonuclease [Candidatus Taylorbacteria bacterium]|nr:ribonuclease [Candidatus Taylorbacteria bacterium]
MSKTIIFTDGSSRGNPGPGGWGTIVSFDELREARVRELGGRNTKTTNNRMELTAVIEGIDFVVSKKLTEDIVLYTDSEYVKKGATEWIHGWKRNDWRTSTKGEVLNRDLWERLSELLSQIKIEFKVIKGHSGVVGNERCDVIATTFADGTPDVLFNDIAEKYKVDLDTAKQMFVSKATKSKSSSKKAYSYVSSIDGVVKTHQTWAECEARVKGKTNARFKKVFSKEEEGALVKSFVR